MTTVRSRRLGAALGLSLVALGGCDAGGSPPPEPPPNIAWAEVPIPAGSVSGPQEVASTAQGEVWAVFVRPGETLYRAAAGAWELVSLPPGLIQAAHLSPEPDGGLALVSQDDGYSTSYVLRRSVGGPWEASEVAPTYLVASDAHGAASNGRGSFLLVSSAGRTSPLLFRKAGPGAWTESATVDGLYPSGPPAFADEQTTLVNGADRPDGASEGGHGTTWRLLRSTDAGATWVRTPLPPAMQFYSLRPGPGGALLAFAGGALFVTRDAGATWAAVPLPAGLGDVAEAALTPSGGYLVVFREPVEGSWHAALTFRYALRSGGEWFEAGAGIAPLLAEPFIANVGGESPRWGGHTSLARAATGHFYLVLQRQDPALQRSTIVRTTAPVP